MKRKKRKVKRFRLVISLFLIAVLSYIVYHMSSFITEAEDIKTVLLNEEPFSYLANQVTSKNAMLVDEETREVLFRKRSDEQIYPASMTKMMTVYVALLAIKDLNQKVIIPAAIIDELEQEGASMAGFYPMEEVSYRDLIYGALLPSGADASVTLAVSIAGSEEAFVEMMNKKAKELGMKNTHFVNVTGLHDDAHISTVADMEKLLNQALQNDIFYQIFTTNAYQTQPDKYFLDGLSLYSTLQTTLDYNNLQNPYILGAKTGYTPEAGLCMASLAEVNQHRYLFVSAQASGDHTTQPYHVLDALHVYQELANQYK